MENTEASADAGLHEFVDIEFMIPALDTPAKEKSLSDALKDLPSVRNLSIAKGKVALQYEAVALSKDNLQQAIAGAGFQVDKSEQTPASALTDAFLEAQQKDPASSNAEGEPSRGFVPPVVEKPK